jgi:cytoskeletal protein RodZ
MKKTKEWIADYLRYFLLLLAIVLLLFLIFITLRVYQRYDKNPGQDEIEILTEADSGQITEKETESEAVTELQTETETETQKETETETAAQTETEGQTDTATRNVAGAASASDGQTTSTEDASSESGNQVDTSAEAVVFQSETTQTEAASAESNADYRTILSTCNLRSYPDYGDNVIGECYSGQTVEFLGEEAGWYKISVDGVVGYIGPKFLG